MSLVEVFFCLLAIAPFLVLFKPLSNFFYVTFVNILLILILPRSADGFNFGLETRTKIVLFLSLVIAWNTLSRKITSLERSISLFCQFLFVLGLTTSKWTILILAILGLSASSIAVLAAGSVNNWRLLIKYSLLSSVFFVSLVGCILWEGEIMYTQESNKLSPILQAVLVIAFLGKLANPLINLFNLPLYQAVSKPSSLSFAFVLVKIAIFLYFSDILQYLDSQALKVSSFLNFIAAVLSFGLLSYTGSFRFFIAASSYLTFSSLLFFLSCDPQSNILLFLMIYSFGSIIVLQCLSERLDKEANQTGVAGITLLILGGLAPFFAITFLKLNFIVKTVSVETSFIVGLLFLASSFFYGKWAAILFRQNSERIPRDLASLFFVLALISLILIAAPVSFF
jgi:hypothetical protein